MPRYNDALSGTSKFRTQQLSPEDQMQGLINQAPFIGNSYAGQKRMKELKKEIEQRHNLEMRSEHTGKGLSETEIFLQPLDLYGIVKGTVNIGGVVIA